MPSGKHPLTGIRVGVIDPGRRHRVEIRVIVGVPHIIWTTIEQEKKKPTRFLPSLSSSSSAFISSSLSGVWFDAVQLEDDGLIRDVLPWLDELEYETPHPHPHLNLQYGRICRQEYFQQLDPHLCTAVMQHAPVLG